MKKHFFYFLLIIPLYSFALINFGSYLPFDSLAYWTIPIYIIAHGIFLYLSYLLLKRIRKNKESHLLKVILLTVLFTVIFAFLYIKHGLTVGCESPGGFKYCDYSGFTHYFLVEYINKLLFPGFFMLIPILAVSNIFANLFVYRKAYKIFVFTSIFLLAIYLLDIFVFPQKPVIEPYPNIPGVNFN